MTVETTIPAPCPELGFEVPVSEIDKELRKLWEQDEARTNASLINLVVYSEKPGALRENSAVIRSLTVDHACRAILVEINPDEPDPTLRAWITAHCHLSNGRKSVCCEQIAFHLTGRVAGRFRNTVFSHLNSDLPLVFWWQGELSDNLTERLVSVMDRLIVDSSKWKHPAKSFRQIEETAQANPDLMIQDHEWTRTWQFRLGVASLFDNPVIQEALPAIDKVEICHHPDNRNAALLMLAWLVEQAGWRDWKPGGTDVFHSSEGSRIQVEFKQCDEGPALSSLVIRAGERAVMVRQLPGEPHVERWIEADDCEMSSISPVDPSSDEELVRLQLDRGGRNSLFHKVLPRFRRMLDGA